MIQFILNSFTLKVQQFTDAHWNFLNHGLKV